MIQLSPELLISAIFIGWFNAGFSFAKAINAKDMPDTIYWMCSFIMCVTFTGWSVYMVVNS